LKESLAEAKVGIATTRPELKGLAATSQSYEETLQALSSIESLRLVTDKLEARISEKRFLSAIDVLQDALRLLRKPELEGIGALSELRTYLTNQETSLTDILIEELHSHLYLKSPYCQDRWKAHVKEISHGISSESADSHASSIQPLYQFLDDLDCRESMVEDATRNPENDSFYYIQLLVESLNKMGSLDEAVNAIVQRLPVELFKVVDKSNKEVVQRHPDYKQNDHSARNCQGIGISEDDDRAIVLCDLLWTLYAKFEAIAESHRVFHDVVLGITKREKIEDIISLTGSFRELWMIYQNEIRSILHDYLATDSNLEHMNRSRHLQTDVYKRGQRNKENTIFKLADTDLNSDTYETDLSDLDAILKASVPGLVSDSQHQTVATSDDKVHLVDGAATGHKLLVEPSVFNMGIMLPPSLAFLQRLKDIVPPEPPLQTGKLTSFLDDFLVNVFLPQLEETLIKYSNRAINEADAFQEDPRWAEVSRRPILKGCSAFYNLITVFCRMLDNLPHDQAFTRLIMNQMSTYYHRSYEWFETLTSRTQSSESYGPSMKASAIIANDPSEVHDVVQKLWTNGDHTLIDKEIGLLILRTNETPLTLSDVISDRKVIKSLCLLYTSMRWLASNISHLRSITQEDADSSRNSRGGTRGRSWTLITKNITLTKVKGPVKLPMTQEKVA
jgi:exocyst complex component 4